MVGEDSLYNQSSANNNVNNLKVVYVLRRQYS